MSSFMNNLSREELYSIINQMKRQINCLKTDFDKTETLLNSFQKYFDYFNEINEKISSNKKILILIKELKKLKQFNKNCLISVKKLPENDFNRLRLKSDQYSDETKVESINVWTQTDLKTRPKWTQTTINNEMDLIDVLSNPIINQNVKNELMSDDNEDDIEDNTYVQNETQFLITSLETNNKQTLSEDNDSDFRANDDNISDNSDEELPETKSTSNTRPTYRTSKGVFCCQFEGCSAKFRFKKSLSQHEIRHSEKYSCDLEGCHFRGGSNYHLERHKSQKHSKERPFLCVVEDCLKRFKTQGNLREHSKKVHSNIDTSIECEYPGCGQTFSDQYLLTKHSNIHLGTFTCHLNGCEFKTSAQTHLDRHKHYKHTNEKKYICEHIGCGKEFSKSHNLRQHQQTHSGKVFKCNWIGCELKFTHRQSLMKHKNKHTGNYRCQWTGCDFFGRSTREVIQHQSKHSTEFPFKCQINECNKTFKFEKFLSRHQLREHPLNFEDFPWIECEKSDCDFKTKCKHNMSQHMDIHNNIHKCCECQKIFRSAHSVKKHMSVHSDQKYGCDWPGCDRLFKRSDYLREHMNAHTGDQVNRCDWPGCDRTFILRSTLRVHMMRHKRTAKFS